MAVRDETPTTAATLKRAYVAIEQLQRRLDEAQRSTSGPIAIIGVGCRFPGGVVDADSFWEVLRTGTDALREIPADRWDVNAYYDKEPQQPGKMIMRTGGFLDRIDQFDHEFFGISRREAVAMDPQQRLTLEVAWEALEHAGQSPADLAGSRTGVFAGVCTNDFAVTHFPHPLDITAYASTGTAHSAVTGRVSYALDLKGPSVSVDTACSSSLVAIHLAAQSLRAGECDLALGGGVNVILSPMTSIAYSQFPGMVSPDGRCKTFDAAADGSIPSEGCGFVVLKRLADAERDGDRIMAVLRGEAVNQDGRSSGLTAPSGLAQRDVIRRALEVSGVRPDEVSYVETHGSGTPLGDPIEVEALAEVYGHDHGAPVYLGTAKTNIGHLQAAAGVAGLIKVVLSLGHGVIPPNLHFERLNPDISFAGTTFAVPTGLTDWPQPAGRRMAGVSSFGFSGTNAHLIVAEAPAVPTVEADHRRPLSVLALSARAGTALTHLAERYSHRLAGTDLAPGDICFSANTGRSHLPYRLAAVGETSAELADQLADFVAGLPGDEPVTGHADNADIVFLFTGQGSQRVGMARELYQTQPTFRRVMDQCDEILQPLLGGSLLAAIYPAEEDAARLREAAYAQPALFAIEYALAELWRSWGIEPVAVLGHSLGEYVAACVAGAMNLEDGLRLVTERGTLMLSLTGTMAVVFAAEADVAAAIADLAAGPAGAQISIAAVNGPSNTVISGDRALVEAACEAFARRGVRTKQLHVTNSGHSALIEPMLPALRQAAQAVRFSPPRIPLVSNVSGELWPWDEAPDAEYWCRHARQPVRFAAGVATLRRMGYRTLLEVGPAPTLLGLIGDGIDAEAEGVLLLPSLRPKHDDWRTLLTTLARLYVRGATVDWRGFDRDYRRSRVDVPLYPFEPTRCWQEPRHRSGQVLDTPAEPVRADDEDVDDGNLLYQLAWQPEPGGASSTDEQAPSTWLILADDDGCVADQLVAALATQGSRYVRVDPGPEYAYDGESRAVVRYDRPDDLIRLLDRLPTSPGESLAVVHLCGISARDEREDSAERQFQAQYDACLSAVSTVQALAKAAPTMPARLWLVTRGAVAPAGSAAGPLAVSQATLWGLGRSLQQEHPAIWGGLIDLDRQAEPGSSVSQLMNAIVHADHEDQVAFREERRYVARLVRAQLDEAGARAVAWRADASYLVTGGLTGIGLEVARSMVLAGARRLVLAGRTPMPPRGTWADLPADGPVGQRVAAVRALERLGASVVVASLDIADEDGVGAFLDRFDREGWPPIRGVVHSAAVAQVQPLLDLTPEDLAGQLRAKSIGAWVLHRAFAERPLDFFVLFGSASSILSSPFTAAYAAANAGVDALAQLRHGEGKPALSIGWGLWQDTGMAERSAPTATQPSAATAHETGSVRAQVRLSSGMGALEPRQGTRVFHHLLGQDLSQIAVVPIDWPTWGRRYQEVSRSALLTRLLDGGADLPARRRSARANHLPSRADVLALPAADRPKRLTAALHQCVAATLGAQPADVPPEQPLVDLGFDSLMAVELRNAIEGRLNVFLPVSAFLANASVTSLADHLLRLLAEPGVEGQGAAASIPRARRLEDRAAEVLAEIDDLTEEQARQAMQGGARI